MIIGRGEAQAAVEYEGRFSHIDHEFAAGTVVYLPARVVTFERQIGQLLEGLAEGLGLLRAGTIRLVCFAFLQGDIGALDRRTGCIEA